jgi:putative DNA primase/helicase
MTTAFVSETEIAAQAWLTAPMRASKSVKLVDVQVWPHPQSFDAPLAPRPYPLDALPPAMRDAVIEVQRFTKAPPAMVATCALSALAVATQARYDVARAVRLNGPVSLFTLIVAASGERKSTVDKFFSAAIVDYERSSRERLKPEIDKATARHDSWDSERGGLLAAIKQASKDGEDTEALKHQLEKLQQAEPRIPKAPRMFYSDTTPEALARGLAKTWPSASLASAEAGTVLGGHGMSSDAIMRNLSLLNQLWDGATITVDRRGDEPFVLRGARLSVSLQAQPEALQSFQEKHGTLARGIGFWARFLIAVSASTQGERMFEEPPDTWPCMAVFNHRVGAILDGTTAPSDAGFTPARIELSPEAKAAWVEFHDAIETALSPDGEFADIRDCAAKIADNAARVAACFEAFKTEANALRVNEESMTSAIAIVSWHLAECQRLLAGSAQSPAMIAAQKVESWMREQGVTSVPKNELLQKGRVRKVADLNEAIAALIGLQRARLMQQDGRDVLTLNPRLSDGAGA